MKGGIHQSKQYDAFECFGFDLNVHYLLLGELTEVRHQAADRILVRGKNEDSLSLVRGFRNDSFREEQPMQSFKDLDFGNFQMRRCNLPRCCVSCSHGPKKRTRSFRYF